VNFPVGQLTQPAGRYTSVVVMSRMTSLRFLSPTLLLLLLAATSGASVTSPGVGGRRIVEPSSRVVDVADPCKAGEMFILV